MGALKIEAVHTDVGIKCSHAWRLTALSALDEVSFHTMTCAALTGGVVVKATAVR